MSIIGEVIDTMKTLAQGMALTLSYIPRKKLTVEYPDVPVEVYPAYRGEHYLARDENGKERCVACFLCSAACPADAIYIEATEDLRDYADRPGMENRYAKVYNIDYGKCILCGYCVEACPKDAIKHGHSFEMAVTDFKDLIKDKHYLLANLEMEKKRRVKVLSDQ
ncbi:MAG: NADH-quinone oxidoreductase subunit I [Blastocatellia bacterium]|nr:NADH-quinone oxidoreductase subunit I [Blastocatellia bacterium]